MALNKVFKLNYNPQQALDRISQMTIAIVHET